jgi:penicillin-binding protein 2
VLGYVGDINAQELQALQGAGYNSQSQIGQSGLESQYESLLHGVPGIQQVEVSPSGYAVSTASTTPAIPGDNLFLNMDLGLEQVTSTALANQIRQLRSPTTPADFGAAVVLNLQTGAVLAMASEPTYNNNLWIPGISQANYTTLVNEYGRPLNNYAIAGSQTPGSTFKLVTATAALDRGLISGSTYYDDTGSFTIGKPPKQLTLADSESSALGEINVSTALGASVDTFFYNLGALFCQQNVGCPTQIQQYAAKYGLGQDPMIDLPNVASGQVDGPQLRVQLHQLDPALNPTTTYYQGENVETAFGQGKTLVTPLQLADAYATFANGGTRYAPQMAAALVSPSGKVTRVTPKVLGHVNLPASTYQPILQGLEDATQSTLGTAHAAFIGFNFTKWNVAGKTGTATAAKNVAPVSWFVAFGGPRNGPPKYAVAVEIDKGGYGATASAPVVRQIFDYLYKHGISQLKLPK